MKASNNATRAARAVSGNAGGRSVLLSRSFLLAVIVCLLCGLCLTSIGCQTRTKGQYDVTMGRSGK